MAAPTIVGTPIRTGFASSRSPATGNVAGAGVLQADDVVAMWIRIGAFNATISVPTPTWANPLGGNTTAPATSGVCEVVLLHKVTSAEVTGGTRAWTLTNLIDTTGQTGAAYTVVVRGVDVAVLVDAFGSAVSSGATTTHVLAGLLGTDIGTTDDLVVSGVGGDGSGTYTTAPTGWTFQVKNSGGQNSGAVLTRDTTTTAGANVTATNISIGTSAAYASITLAFKPIGGADVHGDASLSVAPTVDADGGVVRSSSAPISLSPTVDAAGSRAATGAADISLAPTIAADGTKTQKGDASLSLSPTVTAAGSRVAHGDATISLTPQFDATGSVVGQITGNAMIPFAPAVTADGTVLLKTARLNDLFRTQDDVKWNYGAGCSIVAGTLHLSPTGAGVFIQTPAVYNMLSSFLSVEFIAAGGVDTAWLYTESPVGYAGFYVEGSNLKFIEYLFDGPVQTQSSIPFNASTHRFWRLSEAAGTLIWETSADGGIWTEQWTLAAGREYNHERPALYADGTGTAIFDNLNVQVGNAPLFLEPTIDAAGTLRQKGGATITVAPTITADGHIKVPIVGDANTALTFSITADGSIYKLVPTGWYCYPEEIIPGPPYELPTIPGS